METIVVYNRGVAGGRLEDAVVEALDFGGNVLWSDTISGAANGSVHTFTVSDGSDNELPTLDALADLTIGEDAAEQTVNLTGITDGDSGTQPLRVTASSSSPGTFAAVTNFGAGRSPFSTTVSDFNGDGVPDLAVANDSSNDVSVLLGTGSGSFTAAANYSVGGSPNSVSAGDFNEDGNTDVAVANTDSGTASILLGDGSGSFAAATTFAVGTDPRTVSVADFDEDGHQDLAFANQSDDTVSLVLGNGDGTFGAATNFDVGGGSRSLSVGDFNGDGLQDLVSANRDSDDVSILLGTGTGSFRAATAFDTGAGDARGIALGDFDGDGNQDLVVADSSVTGRVSILLGNGDGTFGTPTKFTAGSAPYSVSVADFNGDGSQDLAVSNLNSDTASILLGTGTGTFGAATNFAVGDLPISVSVGDFNGDDVPDLAVANQGDDNVSILMGEAGIIPTPTVTYSSPNATGSLAFTPAPGQSGSETITVTVEDGGVDNDLDTPGDNATFSRTFDVIVTPAGANTVRVRLTDNNYLQLLEVEVIERGTGTALDDSGTASQSSTYNKNTGAEQAIDGDTTSDYPSSLALTRKELGAWWQVDLSGGFDVETIVVYNRGVAGGRLEDAVVEALDFGGNVLWSDTISGAANGSVHTFTVSDGSDNTAPVADLADPVSGGTIDVGVLNGRDYLDVTFADGDGSGVDPASIDGDELLLSGAGVGTATLDGTVTLVGGNTYRYGLNPAGEFVAGNVDVTFVGGTWQDNAGNAGVSEIETFTVALTPVGVTTVRVRLTDNNYLQLLEVEVFERDTGTALDDSGTASQSSTYNKNTGAEQAIDGDTTSDYPSSLALTRKELGAWWQVDLSGGFDVETIVVYNRGVAGGRLEDAVVEALDFGGNVLWSDTISGAANGSVHTFTVSDGSDNELPTLDALADLTIGEDAAEQTVNLTGITDGDSGTQPLRVTASSSSPGTFAAVTNFGAGRSPFSTTVSDFNGDGVPDLAVANDSSNDVSVLLGTGSGSFTAAANYSVGGSPNSVSAGDFNEDGNTDVAVANTDSGTASILLGDGSGSFAAATTFAVGTDPRTVSVADFDEDGHQDLAFANQSDDTVSLVLGNGDGTFGAATNFDVGGGSRSLSVGDFNGDGLQDLVSANRDSDDVSILLGTGTGSFRAATAFDTGAGDARGIALGDFDGDGNQDLVVADSSVTGRVSILLGNGDGTFGTPTKFTAGSAPYSVSVADFNGDGSQDLAVSNLNSDTASILLGTGTGTFGAATNFAVGDLPISVSVGDFNGDDVPDLAVANQGDDNVSILMGEAGIIPTPTVTYSSPNATGSLAFTPAPGQSGSETITVTVEDGGVDNDLDTPGDNATFSRTFDVIVTPAGANTVRVRLTDNNYLQLLEVEVIERGTGTALDDSGTASQSSTYNKNTGAEQAIDGDTTSDYPSSLALTRKELGAWWQVDLSGGFDVETIVVYNRGVAGGRLEDAVVEALDFGGNVLWSDTISGAANGSVHTFAVDGSADSGADELVELPVSQADTAPVAASDSGWMSFVDDNRTAAEQDTEVSKSPAPTTPVTTSDAAWISFVDDGSSDEEDDEDRPRPIAIGVAVNEPVESDQSSRINPGEPFEHLVD